MSKNIKICDIQLYGKVDFSVPGSALHNCFSKTLSKSSGNGRKINFTTSQILFFDHLIVTSITHLYTPFKFPRRLYTGASCKILQKLNDESGHNISQTYSERSRNNPLKN